MAFDLSPPLDETGFCLFALITGRPCPACGGTRAVLALARLDVETAFVSNAAVTVAVVVVVVVGLVRWRRMVAWVRDSASRRAAFGDIERHLRLRIARYGTLLVAVGIWNVGRW
jgi:hypothetical protein